jgi:hypothetical protein
MRQAVDVILLILVIVGAILAIQTGRERSRLAAHYERLKRKTGDLVIADPSRAYILALPTGEPLSFAWRVYFPANCPYRLIGPFGASSGQSSTASDSIARVRIRENPSGQLEFFSSFAGSSMSMSLGNPKLAALLHGRWNTLLVEQLGLGEIAVVKPGAPTQLLKLTLPDDLQREAENQLSADERKPYVPVLYDLKVMAGTAKR